MVDDFEEYRIDPGEKKCSICGEMFTGYGHNPEPVHHVMERCCNACNAQVVIPTRLARINFGSD